MCSLAAVARCSALVSPTAAVNVSACATLAIGGARRIRACCYWSRMRTANAHACMTPYTKWWCAQSIRIQTLSLLMLTRDLVYNRRHVPQPAIRDSRAPVPTLYAQVMHRSLLARFQGARMWMNACCNHVKTVARARNRRATVLSRLGPTTACVSLALTGPRARATSTSVRDWDGTQGSILFVCRNPSDLKFVLRCHLREGSTINSASNTISTCFQTPPQVRALPAGTARVVSMLWTASPVAALGRGAEVHARRVRTTTVSNKARTNEFGG